jgi:crossover junction endodeoxyribonuclease RusA
MYPWIVELHGERPWTSNAERRWHHMERARRVKDMRESFGWMAKAQGFPKFKTVHITATPLAKNRKNMMDVGACFPAVKAAIDGLVDVGVLPDDDPRYVQSLKFNATEVADVDGLRLEIVEA